MGRFSGMISVAQIMGSVYGKTAQILTGLFGSFLCAGIVAAQVGAMGYVFHVFLDISHWWGIIIGCSIVILYTTFGGMKAVIYTDVMQFVILAVGIPLTLILGLMHFHGMGGLKAAIPPGHLNLFGHMSIWTFILLFCSFLVGETLVPPYVQRLLIGKNVQQTSKGTFYSGLFSLPFFLITGMIGLVALALQPELNANLALPYVIQTILPVGLKGLVISAVIAIVMSSADSYLNSAAIAIVNDVIKPLAPKRLNPSKELKLAMLATFLVGLLSVVIAIKINSILDILLFAYHFWAPVVLAPLIAVLLGKQAPAHAFPISAAMGLTATLIISHYYPDNSAYALCAGVLANTIVFISISKCYNKLDTQEIIPRND